MTKLLTAPEAQPKTRKSLKLNVLTYAMHLAPADLSGRNVCPMSTAGCRAACLNTAGRGVFDSVQAARIRRTDAYFADRAEFMATLYREISNALARAKRDKMRLAVRLNATSDIPWERVPFAVNGYNYGNIMAAFPRVQFYDYTKIPKRAMQAARRDATWPRNYHLTYSLSEAEDSALNAYGVLANGGNVAIVYRTAAMCSEAIRTGIRCNGAMFPAVNGDLTDARFKDRRGAFVTLYAKGRAKRDQSGFVREI